MALDRFNPINFIFFSPLPQCKLIHAFALVYEAIVKCQYQSIVKAGQLEGTLLHLYVLAFKCSVNLSGTTDLLL